VICFWTGRAVSENRRLAPGQDRWRAIKDYKAFKDSIAWTCKAHMERFDGPVAVRLLLVLNPKMDAQNVIKPVLDALELAGVIRNDRQVRTFSFYREDRPSGEKDDRIGIIVQEVG
jgi:Holliday junction resolvase RusA-like endonuclease